MAHSLITGRRALSALALAAAVRPARADTPSLAMICDTTLGPALNKVSAAYTAMTSVRVFVFPTGTGLILPQLQRDSQADIAVTRLPILDRAEQVGIATAANSSVRWRNPLVIARAHGATTDDRTVAASDPTPASDLDGPSVLTQLGLKPARVLGAVDTSEVAFLLTRGMAQEGLIYMSDVRAHPDLAVISRVSDDVQPAATYGVSVMRRARPGSQDFVSFLSSPAASRLLSDGGLEVQA